jgi:hypothetical protein
MRRDPIAQKCGSPFCQSDVMRADKLMHQIFELVLCVGVPGTVQRLWP